MMPLCDPLSPGFFTIVHLLLHLWAANISLNGLVFHSAIIGGMNTQILCSTMLRNGLYGGSFFSSVFSSVLYISGAVVGRCTIIYKYDVFIRIEIQPFLSQDVTEPLCIHTTDNC